MDHPLNELCSMENRLADLGRLGRSCTVGSSRPRSCAEACTSNTKARRRARGWTKVQLQLDLVSSICLSKLRQEPIDRNVVLINPGVLGSSSPTIIAEVKVGGFGFFSAALARNFTHEAFSPDPEEDSEKRRPRQAVPEALWNL